MSKELEALVKLKDRADHDEYLFRQNTDKEKAIKFLDENSSYVSSIETALKEHEQYKAIEQELGIGLATLLKALKGLIYKPTYEKMIKYCGGRYPRYEEGFHLRYNEPTNKYFLEVGSPLDEWQVLELKDYGKTWALTRKELNK